MGKVGELYEMEETTELSTQSFSEGGNYILKYIDDAMITKDNDNELQYSGSNSHSGENIAQINVSQDSVLRRSRHKNVPGHCFEIKREHFICVPPEDEELVSFHEVLSSPIASE